MMGLTITLKGCLPHKLAEQVKQDFTSGQYEKRYWVEKKQLGIWIYQREVFKWLKS